MARILVLGAGFAGLWAAVGAARKLDEIGTSADEVEILLVDRNPYHNIRVRNYEVDLSDVAIPLGEVLDPIGVRHLAAEVQAIDVVVSALGARPRRLRATSRLPSGSAPSGLPSMLADAAWTECKPLTNLDEDAEWRRDMVRVHVKKALERLLG